MRKLLALAIFALGVGASANADSIPTYNMTSGTVSLTYVNIGWFNTTLSMSNGTGMTIGLTDTWANCLNFAPGGSSCSPYLLVGYNEESSNVNGTQLYLFGGLTITGASFTLPTSGNTFSVTSPVLFSGSFRSCPGTYGSFGGCSQPLTWLGAFNINGPGLVTMNFSSFDTGNGLVWVFTTATYTLSATLEPATFVLLGTGALAIFGKLRLRKN